MSLEADARHMARAIALARRGWYTTAPNPRVGAVLVNQDEVFGEGWHRQAGEPHAEVLALQAAREAGHSASGAILYVSLEPCSHTGRTQPCTGALIEAGLKRVVVGMPDPNPRVAGKGIKALEAAGIEVTQGVLEADAEALNPGFISRMTRGRPRVRLKLAMSLDGRTAMASGESRWITGEAARKDVHRLRAEAGAVLTGIGTVLADDPRLNVRLDSQWRQPLRVVLDSRGRTPANAKLLTGQGASLLICTEAAADQYKNDVEVLCLPGAEGRIDLAASLAALAEREINDVLVEAGPTLSGAFLAAGLVDELVLYVAPRLLGDAARGLVTMPGLDRLDQGVDLDIRDIRRIGADWRIIAQPRMNETKAS